jgi:hypothetical protein
MPGEKEQIMDKTTIISIVLGATGTVSGITGTVLGIVNSKGIKKLSPLESRMTTVESSVNSILNPTVVVQQAPTAPAAPAPQNQAQNTQQAQQ